MKLHFFRPLVYSESGTEHVIKSFSLRQDSFPLSPERWCFILEKDVFFSCSILFLNPVSTLAHKDPKRVMDPFELIT